MSTSFYINSSIAREAQDRPLKFTIADDHTISTMEVYQDYVLEIFAFGFPVDLIPIVMGDVCMIAGMCWLRQF